MVAAGAKPPGAADQHAAAYSKNEMGIKWGYKENSCLKGRSARSIGFPKVQQFSVYRNSSLHLALKAREELLLMTTLFVCATRTSQGQLARNGAPVLQVLRSDIGDGLDKVWRVVEGLASLDTGEAKLWKAEEFLLLAHLLPGSHNRPKTAHLLGLFEVLEIQLKQRLNVITRKGNRHQQNVVVLLLRQPLDGVARLRSQPRGRTHLRLPYETVRVLVAETMHDGRHGRANLAWVRISSVHDRHRQRVRRK